MLNQSEENIVHYIIGLFKEWDAQNLINNTDNYDSVKHTANAKAEQIIDNIVALYDLGDWNELIEFQIINGFRKRFGVMADVLLMKKNEYHVAN